MNIVQGQPGQAYEHFSHFTLVRFLCIFANSKKSNSPALKSIYNVFRRVKKVGIHSFNYRTLVYLVVNPVERAFPKTSVRSLINLQYNPDI